MSLESKTPSLEAIQYQGESKLFKELIVCFEKLALVPKLTQNDFDKSDFSKIIKDNTGLQVKLKLGSYLSAYTYLPYFGINNSTTFGRLAAFKDEVDKEQYAVVRKLGNKNNYEGKVDLRNSKVSGVFSEIPLEIYLGTFFVGSTSKLNPRETAAVVLHELGHLFTHFETLNDFLTVTVTVGTALKEMSKQQVAEKRLKLLNGLRSDLKLPQVDDASLVSKIDNDVEIATITIREYMLETASSRFGSESYDARSCEQLADQFAARHGAARDLTTALGNLGMGWKPNTALHILGQILRLAVFVVYLVWAPVATVAVTILYLLIPGLDRDLYDPPYLRIERMRKDLIQVLKNPNLSPEHRKNVLSDLNFMEAFAHDVEEHRSIIMFLWTTISTRRRKEYDRKKFQLEIERLLNNDLFVSANQLKSMS